MKGITIVCVLLLACAAALGCGDSGSNDYDVDDDGLVEVSNLEQLDAIRWDLDGDGSVDDAADADVYASAFPGAVGGMGCPGSGCTGYELTKNLDFNDSASYASGAVRSEWTGGSGWLPVGGHATPFGGILDGGEYTIANLFIDRSDRSYVGLFGEISGVVRQLGVVDIQVRGSDTSGGLAGANSGTVTGSYVTGVVSCFRDSGGLVGANYGVVIGSYSVVDVTVVSVVGGLVGLNYGQVRDSYSMGKVVGSARVAGGLAGINFDHISGSYSEAETSASDIVGGLIAINQGPLSAGYSSGAVSGEGDDVGGLVGVNYNPIDDSYSTGSVSGNHRVGGLVGMNRATAEITTSYATGSVSGGVGVGGLAGWSLGSVRVSYATGSVAAGDDDAGGLIGRNGGSVGASYSTGNVSGYHRVGGLVGYNSEGATIDASYATGDPSGEFEAGGLAGWNRGSIVASYAVGRVSAMRDAGGLIGENTGSISASYWNTEASGNSSGVGYGASAGVNGVTTAELQSSAGYEGVYALWGESGDVWDFRASSQYPVLKADIDGDGKATAQEFGNQ